MQTTPFKRENAMMAAIATIMTLPSFLRQGELSNLGAYKSRGHGLGKLGKNYFKSNSKYMPHQGVKEKARRLRQAQRNHG